jgi:hypothetical protein
MKKTENYQRIFKSEPKKSFNFRSPVGSVFQWLNKEDENIRLEIEEKYTSSEFGFGFDGEVLYSYNIEGSPPTCSENQKKRNKYLTKITIKKMGAEEDILKESELEKFLIENKFEKILN